jgi:hypothetical protein
MLLKYIHSGLGNGEATGGSDWKNTCTQSIRSEYFSRSVVTGRNSNWGIEQSKIRKNNKV